MPVGGSEDPAAKGALRKVPEDAPSAPCLAAAPHGKKKLAGQLRTVRFSHTVREGSRGSAVGLPGDPGALGRLPGGRGSG